MSDLNPETAAAIGSALTAAGVDDETRETIDLARFVGDDGTVDQARVDRFAGRLAGSPGTDRSQDHSDRSRNYGAGRRQERPPAHTSGRDEARRRYGRSELDDRDDRRDDQRRRGADLTSGEAEAERRYGRKPRPGVDRDADDTFRNPEASRRWGAGRRDGL